MAFSTASNTERRPIKENKLVQFLILVFLVVWASTFIGTSNFSNWFLENGFVFIGLSVLILSYKKFKFSDLSYVLICLYLCLHTYGSKYTYAENPFGYWLKNILHLERNHYDRIVHFSFGFLMAYPLRDYFKTWFQWPVWVCWVLPIEITLSFSGMFEIVEWLVADLFFPSQGDAYLGTQGDIWDPQKDMGLAFTGAISIMLISFLLKKILKR